MQMMTGHVLRIAAAWRSPSWWAGFAVRVDWPGGHHTIVGWRLSWRAAHRVAETGRRYWRTTPGRPVAWSVVVISRRDAVLHRRRPGCKAPDCPVGVPVAAGVPAVSR